MVVGWGAKEMDVCVVCNARMAGKEVRKVAYT